MPLVLGDLGDLQEQPLSRNILETWLHDAQFHSTAGVNQNFGKASRTACADLSPDALAKVNDSGPDDESPTEVTNTMVCGIEGEAGGEVGIDRVSHEAASSVGVETKHEEESEVMGVPERFKALSPDLLVSSTVHEHHDEEHEVTSDSTRLGVVDLKGSLLANLSSFDINEVDIMSSGVDHRPESHGIRDLSVEPDVFVGRE